MVNKKKNCFDLIIVNTCVVAYCKTGYKKLA